MFNISIQTELPSPEGFVSLRKETDWGNLTLPQSENALEHSLCGVTAFDGEKIIGMARVIGDGILNLYIQDVIIAHGYRGHGFGQKILFTLIEHLKSTYAEDCTIGLMAAKGQTHFYKQFGFEVRPSEETDSGMTAPLSRLKKSQLVKTVSNA